MERHKLSKSQSAAVIECDPVTSTNKLEKPRRVQQQEPYNDNSNSNNNNNTCSMGSPAESWRSEGSFM